jgi:hypothetical protein
MTAPTTNPKAIVVPPNLPTGTPAWLNNIIKLLLVAVPIILAIWQPGGNFSTPVVQACIVTGGVLLAGGIHIVEYLVVNFRQHGISVATITATESEAAAYIKLNLATFEAVWNNIRQFAVTYPTLKPAIDSLIARHEETAAKVAALEAKPVPTEDDVRAVAHDEFTRILEAGKPDKSS